ncbi:MAG: TolC family protein [Holophagales bacterium]|nr:TolC family protein [Holophagales bacterium]
MIDTRSEGARRVATLCLALGVLAPAVASVPAGAQESSKVEVSTQLGDAPGAPSLRADAEGIRLTVEEAVTIALERNLGLRVQRYDRERSRLGIEQAMGVYDLGLTSSIYASENESPAASNLDGADVQKTNNRGFDFDLAQLLPSGGIASLSWQNNRFETNSQFSILNPSFSSGLDFTLEQPLLRGFGRRTTEYSIEIAKNSDQISRELFTQQVIETVRQVQSNYWLLVGTRYALRVAEESLSLAEELHANNKTRVDVGTLAPLELVQSEAGIASRQEEIIRARAAIGDAEDALRTLLNLPSGELWSKPLIPESAEEVEPESVDLEAALASALENRSEIAAQQMAIQGLQIDSTFYRQETKPRLDLRATYGFNGVGGDVLIRDQDGNVVDVIGGGWDDALKQITDTDFPGWTVGLQFTYPIQNRQAKARAAIADVQLDRGRLDLENLEQQISTEVRTTVRALNTTRQQIESARVSVKLEERNLDAERKKYENGLSTSFQILQVQEDLTSARYRLVAAATSYRRAQVDYQRAIGQLLGRAGIRVTD